MRTQIIIAIGSNVWAKRKIAKARRLFANAVIVTAESQLLRNSAIGIEAPDFTNQIIVGYTSLDEESLLRVLKNIEATCGDTIESRREMKVNMDLDLLAFGNSQRHVADWKRGYIRQLFSEIYTNDIESLLPIWCEWAKS